MKKYYHPMLMNTSLLKGFNRSLLILLIIVFCGCQEKKEIESWNEKYNFIYGIRPIIFHYDHGILAGSYPQNKETTEVKFNDVCNYMGHVCLCGAGGYKVSELAINSLKKPDENLEKGDFILISSRDHSVSDVISFVLGCTRRTNLEKNQYFINSKIEAPKREYHYFIGYPPQKKAVHIIYRKYKLIGNELMDRLWKTELDYEDNPSSVNQNDLELYQNEMFKMIEVVLLDQKNDLFTIEPIEYDKFRSMLNQLKEE